MSNKYYQDLLQRDEWQEKRLEILKRDNYTCQFCGKKENLNVHHFNYDAALPWLVNDIFLITLCKDCHTKYHKTPFGFNIVDSIHFKDCKWLGFSKERLLKEGFSIIDNFALMKFGDYILYLQHLSNNENVAKIYLFKPKYSKNRYHECLINSHLELDDYIEDLLYNL